MKKLLLFLFIVITISSKGQTEFWVLEISKEDKAFTLQRGITFYDSCFVNLININSKPYKISLPLDNADSMYIYVHYEVFQSIQHMKDYYEEGLCFDKIEGVRRYIVPAKNGILNSAFSNLKSEIENKFGSDINITPKIVLNN